MGGGLVSFGLAVRVRSGKLGFGLFRSGQVRFVSAVMVRFGLMWSVQIGSGTVG